MSDIQRSNRGTHGFLSRLNAWFLNRGTQTYNKLTHRYKKELLSGLSGKILEIGPGTGANLDYYPAGLDLWVLEPSPYMRNYLKKKAEDTDLNIRILTGIAESIPFPDNKFDAAVSTLVLCSVDDVEQSLSEILRVLKPGGRFYFIEHVAAPDQSRLRTLQNWITPLWKFMTDGCHPNRDTAKYIRKSGFKDLNIERTGINLPVVSPHIIGSAAKPA